MTEKLTPGIPGEHAVFPIPYKLMKGIAAYLGTKPYLEVVGLLDAIGKVAARDVRALTPKSIEPTPDKPKEE